MWIAKSDRRRGFTLIELLVVLSILALLATIAVPRYYQHVEQAEEAVLRENLHRMRDAIDKYYGDNGRYPERLDDLVARRYLRAIPPDPLTDSAETWIVIAPEQDAGGGGVADVRSGAQGMGRDGSAYASW